MQLTPTIAVHMTAAIAALAIGPIALWARKGATQRPRLHRTIGYAWVALMVIVAVSAIFIRDPHLPNIAGFSPIHILVPFVLLGLYRSFRALAQGDIRTHRILMQVIYFGGCVVAGLLTLLPGRYLGTLLDTRLLVQIAINTPLWVWGLLAALLALGYGQTRDRQAGIVRMTLTPLGMTTFSLGGLVSTFGNSSLFPAIAAAWGIAAVAVFSVLATGTAAGRYEPATRRFQLPGSWMPLALILGVFMVKYASGVMVAMNPARMGDPTFSLVIATLGGLFSGVFLGRAFRVLKLAVRPSQPAIVLQA